MSKIQVLVTTMHQKDFRKYEEMHLQTDAIFANQTDRNTCEERNIKGNKVLLVSTNSRGVSRNRNIALSHSNQKSDYLVFADDDLVFVEEYEKKIIEEFERHPYAEAIKFNLHDLSDVRKISMKRIEKFEKATKLNMSSSGVWGIAIKTSVIAKHNFYFNENFGPGTENFCGEDTIFIMKLIDSGVSFYRSPVDIAGIDQTESTWFKGHDEHYFTTAGMVIGTVYPHLSYFIVVRSAYRFSKRGDVTLPFWRIVKCYYNGIKQHV